MAGRVAKSLDALLPGRVGGASFREHHDASVNRQQRIPIERRHRQFVREMSENPRDKLRQRFHTISQVLIFEAVFRQQRVSRTFAKYLIPLIFLSASR
jgi:hypothetical protein